MSIGFLVDPDQALIWRGPMVTGALIQLLRDVNWGELDYLVLDLPPGTGDIPLTLAQNVRAAGVVLVSTPQDVALADVIRAKLMFDKVSIPVLGIVENMSSFICPHCRTETADLRARRRAHRRREDGHPLPRRDPDRPRHPRGRRQRRPRSSSGAPDSPQAEAFLAVARNVAGAVSTQVLKAPRLPVIGAQPRA